MRRNTTGVSGRPRGQPSQGNRRAMSWKDLADRKTKSHQPTVRQQKIPIYRLEWPKLKAVLEKIFPEQIFKNFVSVEEDFYLVEIPEALTSGDLRLIEDARDCPIKREPILPTGQIEPPRRESSEEPTS